MKPIIFALLALLLGMHTVCGEGKTKKRTEVIPKEYAKEKAICLKLDSRSEKNGLHTIKVRLINPTPSPVTFTGYSESSPMYKIQRWIEGNWAEHQVGWFCGTGLRQCVIPSAQSSIIPVGVKDYLFPIRVGVVYVHGEKKKERVVWSERIEREPSNQKLKATDKSTP